MSTQQVVGKVKAAQHIKKSAGNAYRRYRMVVDRHLVIVPESRPARREFLGRVEVREDVDPESKQPETQAGMSPRSANLK